MSNSKKRVTFNDDVEKENYTLLYQPIVTLDRYLNNKDKILTINITELDPPLELSQQQIFKGILEGSIIHNTSNSSYKTEAKNIQKDIYRLKKKKSNRHPDLEKIEKALKAKYDERQYLANTLLKDQRENPKNFSVKVIQPKMISTHRYNLQMRNEKKRRKSIYANYKRLSLFRKIIKLVYDYLFKPENFEIYFNERRKEKSHPVKTSTIQELNENYDNNKTNDKKIKLSIGSSEFTSHEPVKIKRPNKTKLKEKNFPVKLSKNKDGAMPKSILKKKNNMSPE